MSGQARVNVATIVTHVGCGVCERLADEAVQEALAAYPEPTVIVRRDTTSAKPGERFLSCTAQAIIPARVARFEETPEGFRESVRWWRLFPGDVSPAKSAAPIIRRIEAAADRLLDEAREAMVAYDYDEMRELEARAGGMRQAARLIAAEVSADG